ncbi:MAG: flavodoxin family protein [Defluviitaleaceae bacterium]|nr:flavodoxin family protein [Defluviitaleaceae bacterium]
MNVLGISGTPRVGGNSEVLLDAALEPFVETGWGVTRVLLSEKTVAPCTGCETCVESGVCFISDDMVEIYEAFRRCDAVVISAPAYYRNVPAQLKAVFDRTFAARGALEGKLGGAICVGRGQGGGLCIVLNIIYNYFLSCGVLCVPGELNGVTAVADKAGEVAAQPRRLEQARVLGRNILKYAK